MTFGVVDLLITIFLVLGAILGFKNGALKAGIKFVGFFAIVIVAFMLKDELMVVLYQNLPFFNFLGGIRGITVLNILIYQLAAFLIIFMALLFVLRVILVITGLLEWLIKLTVFLNLPSKIIGAVIGTVEYYVYIFIALYILSMPIFNLTFVSESKLAADVLDKTPLLSDMIGDTVKVYSEVLNVLKDKSDKDNGYGNYQKNELILALILDNNLVSIEDVRELVDSNKLVLNDENLLEHYTNDGKFYSYVKDKYNKFNTILEYKVTMIGDKTSSNGIEVTTNYISNKTCAAAGICNNNDLIQLSLTVNKGGISLNPKIHTNGEYYELYEIGYYIYSVIRDGWVYVGIAK